MFVKLLRHIKKIESIDSRFNLTEKNCRASVAEKWHKIIPYHKKQEISYSKRTEKKFTGKLREHRFWGHNKK